jgi:MFS family permease
VLASHVERCYTLAMITDYLSMLRLFGRDLRLFLITGALVALAWDGMRSVVLNLYLLRLGYGPEFVGLVNAVGALAFALLCPLAGAMGSRWGSRRMLIVGLGMLAAGFCLLPLTDSLTLDVRTGWLLGTTVFTYLGFALYLVNGLPFMMGATGTRERNHAFSFHSALLPLAAFCGSLVAGILPGILASLFDIPLTEPAPYRYTLWLAALLLLPAVPVLVTARSAGRLQVQAPALQSTETGSRRAPIGLILIIVLFMALRFGGRGPVVNFFNVYLDDGLGVSTALIGILSASALLIAVPAALVAPLMVARFGNARTIAWGMVGLALCTLPLALLSRWPSVGLAYIGSSAMFALTVGPLRLFSQELVAPRWQTVMASAFMLGSGSAFATLSLVGGYVIVSQGYRALFLIATGLISAAILLFWFYFRVPRGELARPTLPGVSEQVAGS